jgi:hypothetical protein
MTSLTARRLLTQRLIDVTLTSYPFTSATQPQAPSPRLRSQDWIPRAFPPGCVPSVRILSEALWNEIRLLLPPRLQLANE